MYGGGRGREKHGRVEAWSSRQLKIYRWWAWQKRQKKKKITGVSSDDKIAVPEVVILSIVPLLHRNGKRDR